MVCALEKYAGFRAELAIAETLEELLLIENKAAAIAEFGRKDKIGLAEQNQWGKFRIEIEAKKGAWLEQKFPQGGDRKSSSTKGELDFLLKDIGITANESANARLVLRESELVSEAMEAIENKQKVITPSLVAKEVRNLKKIITRKENEEKGKKIELPEIIDFRLGDFEDVLADIPNSSVDCIITDPPYPIEFIECWTKLARFAKCKLKPNGFCIAYSGQMNLPEVIKRMDQHLDYYWTFALYLEGQTQIVNGVNLICRWKPVLIYQNGKKKIATTIQDYIISDYREKEHHDWQQGKTGVMKLIEQFTNRGDLIVEPFAGGGTTIKAAVELGRNIIAAEIDETMYFIAKAAL